jgi:single-strand DNA-binding protein
MNKLIIIGNLTKDPELRTTQSGINVCSFTVAVNRRGQQDTADFFRVNAWRELGENCAKWLIKGKKVCVVGSVSVSSYTGQDGKNYANLEVLAQDVEFLSPAGTVEQDRPQERPQQADEAKGFTAVETDELPF